MKRHSIWIGVALVALGLGCVGGSKGLSAEDKDKLKPYILDSAPADIPHKTDINFENKVHLIGYKFDPENAHPGADVKITYWWRVDDTIEDGWQLFTHVRDDAADRTDNLDMNGPLRELRNNKQLLGPDRWEKGKVYVDEQTYKIPADVKGPEITIMVGIWKGDARLRIISGANDGDNRAIVGKIKTGVSQQEQHTTIDIPAMAPNKLAATDKIVIDGKGDDAAWQTAASTGPFVDVGTGKPNTSFPVNASARVTWDDTNLYVLFDVVDPDITGGFTNPKDQPNDWTSTGQPKLWTKDTVEIMVDPGPDGDNKNYYEIQINPQNKVFHSQYDDYNVPKTEPNGPFGHEDWDPKLKSAVVVKGTLDKTADKDQGYVVEAAIPWAAFTKGAPNATPPKPGDVWRLNFYAMQQNAGVAWSAILGQGNFHKASRFGRVTWTVPGAPTAFMQAGLEGGAPINPMAGPRGVFRFPPRGPAAIPPPAVK